MSIYDKASLVLIPSGTKTSKVYSQKPTNGDGDFTFSRSTAATRVNASGNIEKETSNLLLQSNTFDTTWSTFSASVTSGQADKDGGTDAWLLQNTASSISFISQSVVQSGVQTFSIYAKGGNVDWLRVNAIVSGSNANAYFDITNGTIGSSSGAEIDKTITSAGNGFYRITLSFNDTISQIRVQIADGDGDENTALGSNIYIQDAQLEQGLVARDYIETTTTAIYGGITDNVPRLDYQGSCPALLLEPQRTNDIPYSEWFGYSGWSKIRCTITDNYAISPEGFQNAALMTATGDDARLEEAITLSGDYTQSIWVKSGQSGDVAGQIDFAGIAAVTFTANQEWQRVETTADSFHRVRIRITNSGDKLLVYGAQLEAGSYATSYIPTYGSAVTRNADDCDALSATSLIGQSEGTLFLDFVANDEDALQIIYQVRTTGSSNVGQIDFRIQGGNLRALGNDASTGQFNISAGAAVVGTRYKCAVRYKNNDVAFYVNGILKGTDTSASFSSSSLDQITFNENGTTFYPIVNVNQALIIPTALTNAELADLTTL